jgi:integrase
MPAATVERPRSDAPSDGATATTARSRGRGEGRSKPAEPKRNRGAATKSSGTATRKRKRGADAAGKRRKATGIRKRHTKSCPARADDSIRCRCDGGYEAQVYSARDKRTISKTFTYESEAKTWRAETIKAVKQGALRAPTKRTFREAAEAWIEGAEQERVLNRSGEPFKPSTLRGYVRDLREHIIPAIGHLRLSTVTTEDLQALVDGWLADEDEPVEPSTVRNRINPVRAVYRRGKKREGLAVNPTIELELPAANAEEVQIVGPQTAERLLDAIESVEDRAIWGTALYAGLRFGELRALSWRRVSLKTRRIYVRKSWDQEKGLIPPKSKKSKRTVPIPARLLELLERLRRERGRVKPDGLVFSTDGATPFHATSLYRRADDDWQQAELSDSIRLHKARHAYGSYLIHAGANAKAVSTFMGHSSIKVTYDVYGHLLPGAEDEAAELLDRFLENAAEDDRGSAEQDDVDADTDDAAAGVAIGDGDSAPVEDDRGVSSA